MHVMPGEVLDFLAVLPYLKVGSVVVMHDVSYNQAKPQNLNGHATTVLFSAVTAEKFLNFIPDDGGRKYVYPNIAAFHQRYYLPELCKIFLEAIKMNLYNMVIASYT